MAAEVLDWPAGSSAPTSRSLLFLHRITPARQTLDYGKTRLGLDPGEAAQVGDALERDRHALDQARHGARPAAGSRPCSKPTQAADLQDAAFAEMTDAYVAASSDGAYPVLSQQVFYAARPKILAKLDREEAQPGERARFCYILLPQFMQENPELTARWRVLYKPRGELIEPHTSRRVGLGTAEVAAYRAGWTNGLDLAETDVGIGDWEPFTCGPHNRFGAGRSHGQLGRSAAAADHRGQCPMSDQPRMVKLCDLWGNKNAKGVVYFSGFMGDAQVLLFQE